jgi:hypothetical protein
MRPSERRTARHASVRCSALLAALELALAPACIRKPPGPAHASVDTTREGLQAVPRTEIEESVAMGLPLVIGEFAHAGVGCSRSIDYATILDESQRAGIGWLAWSWGPGNQDCGEMDMTTAGTFETLQGWGKEVSVDHPASIQKTAKIPESMYRSECAAQLTR